MLGTKNPSDVLTKFVSEDLLQKHLESLGVRLEGGRAESAPEMSSIESITTEIEWEQNLNDENDKMKTVKFGSVVKFRAIPANNRGRKPGRLSRKHRSIGMDEPAIPNARRMGR